MDTFAFPFNSQEKQLKMDTKRLTQAFYQFP